MHSRYNRFFRRMTKQEVIEKVKQMFIEADPRLADESFRRSMGIFQKIRLVTQMIDVARKVELMNE